MLENNETRRAATGGLGGIDQLAGEITSKHSLDRTITQRNCASSNFSIEGCIMECDNTRAVDLVSAEYIADEIMNVLVSEDHEFDNLIDFVGDLTPRYPGAFHRIAYVLTTALAETSAGRSILLHYMSSAFRERSGSCATLPPAAGRLPDELVEAFAKWCAERSAVENAALASCALAVLSADERAEICAEASRWI